MKRLARFLAMVLTLLAAAVLLAWVVGRAATDRTLYTQYLFWIPAWWMIGAAGSALLGVFVLARLGGKAKGRNIFKRLRRALAVVWVLVLAVFVFTDLRVLNFLKERPQRGAVRIMHWNVTGVDTPTSIRAALAKEDPDIVVFVNTWSRVGWEAIIQEFGPPIAMAWEHGILVLAKPDLPRYGATYLGLQALPPDTTFDFGARGKRMDPGRALWLEFDTKAELGRSMTVVVYDMPSDLRRWRWKLALNARNALSEWEGPLILRDQRGQTTREPVKGYGFPKPDVVIGDFNIPRGSGSLAMLAPGMTNAFDQGGAGYVATYPRWRPLAHIDHTFVAPWLRAVRYRVADPGEPSSHLYQVTDLVAR
jgi:hypothetical protein